MSAELSPRQFAVKAIHEDKLNVKNPSILAKLLNDYAQSLLSKKLKEKDKTMTCPSCHEKDVEKRYVCDDCGTEWD